jgi:hypothetical protein
MLTTRFFGDFHFFSPRLFWATFFWTFIFVHFSLGQINLEKERKMQNRPGFKLFWAIYYINFKTT